MRTSLAVKHLPAMRETWVQSLGQEDPLGKGMATHSSILAWRIPWQRSLSGYSPWHSPGKNTGVGSLSLIQGISLTQGLNPGLPHCRQTLYHLTHPGSPSLPLFHGQKTPCDSEMKGFCLKIVGSVTLSFGGYTLLEEGEEFIRIMLDSC